MSLASKLDVLAEVIMNGNLYIACITEPWLYDHIHNIVVSIPGYNLVRRDRIDDYHHKRPAGKLQGHSELILGKSQHRCPCKEQSYL